MGDPFKREYTAVTADIRDYVASSEPSLNPLLDDLLARGAADFSKDAGGHAEMALIAMLETGAGARGAIGLLLSFLEADTLATLQITDKPLLRILGGIKTIRDLNTSKANMQSENFMKFLLLLSEDLQALLAVQAIKLWQLRNYSLLTPMALQRLLAELEHLYLPLAHRLGLYAIKTEMEDFIMRLKNPEIYHSIARELQDSESARLKYIEDFIKPIRICLTDNGYPAEIRYRIKSIPSIWRKMKAQQIGLKEVFDVFAIRVIDHAPDGAGKKRCWEIYSLITDIYKPDPERLRDWISVPRPSGYESLHTTVLGAENRWVEVQIRTSRMDQAAEYGPAAHWRYKEGKTSGSYEWLTRAMTLLVQGQETLLQREDTATRASLPDEIFTITPAGDLVRLPSGATVLDFAFDIHSEVGLRCKGAKVNGKMLPIRHRLQNGDKVEIHTSTQPNLAEDWLKIVVTTKAKNRIRKALKERKELEYNEGKEILERKLRQWKAGGLDEHMGMLLQHFKIRDVGTFYSRIASEKITTSRIREVIDAKTKTKAIPATPKEDTGPIAEKRFAPSEEILLINEQMKTSDVLFAPCCKPVYGDPVFGFVTVGKGIKIHRNNCPNATDMKSRYPYRVISCRWTGQAESSGINATLVISGRDTTGILNAITDVLSNDMKVMIRSIGFDSGQGRFSGTIRIFVQDQSHLGWVIRKLSVLDGIEKVIRSKGERY